jgi:small neutral amino acid transporter SnatA (MarC family)
MSIGVAGSCDSTIYAVAMAVGVAVAMAIIFVFLLLATKLVEFLGPAGIDIMAIFMGLIVMALAVWYSCGTRPIRLEDIRRA